MNFVLTFVRDYAEKSDNRKSQMVYVKYVHVNRSYNKLLCEINNYNQIIGRYLDMIFFVFISVIAFMVFILISKSLNFLLIAIFTIMCISHIIVLSIVILACASITTGNEAISKRTLQLFNISLKRHFHTVQLMKVCPRGRDFVSQKQLIPV